MYTPESVLKNATHEILWNFEAQADGSHNSGQKTKSSTNWQKKTKKKTKKRTCWPVDFAVLADHRIKIQKKKKINKYSDQKTKKLWNMRMTVIPVVVGELGTVPVGLETGLEEL